MSLHTGAGNGAMNSELARISLLTEKQRQCLHLVVLRKTSKEIARELGISKPTVDQRIANARDILGVNSRDTAAMLFAKYDEKYDRVIYDPVQVPTAQAIPDTNFQETHFNDGLRLEEAAIPYSGISEYQPSNKAGFLGSFSSDLNTTKRLLTIVGMTVGILCIVLIGLAVAQSISGLLTAS
jgi:DNA-binding CsgD family transcriptional regulator